MSHPTWVRGLKLYADTDDARFRKSSHPTWVRGLKLLGNAKRTPPVGRTLRGCVD